MKKEFISILKKLTSCTFRKRESAAFCFLVSVIWNCGLFFPLQGQISLPQCRDSAYAHYPFSRKYDLIRQACEYNLSNVAKGYLPQGTLGAQALWQSQVTSIPVKVPGLVIPRLSKDQYRVQLEINQLLYDGGRIGSQKNVIRNASFAEKKEWEVAMYSVYEQVDQLYFGILLLEEKIVLNDLLQADLKRNLYQIEQSLKYGVATPTDIDEMQVALLDARQQRIDLDNGLLMYRKMLSLLTGIPAGKLIQLMRPSGVLPRGWVNHRPELDLIDAGLNVVKAKERQLTASKRPVLGLFLQGIYGRPGLNMLQNKFDYGWVGGIRLSYSFSSLYTLKKEKALLDNERLRLHVERSTFLFNTDLQLINRQTDLKRILDLLQQDDEIIRLRGNIVKASEAKLRTGTIQVNDLLRDISSENRALQQKALHEIESLQTIWKMKQLTNN